MPSLRQGIPYLIWLREIGRAGRQTRTYGLRVLLGLVGALLLTVSWSQIFDSVVDRSEYARLGRQLFESFALVQVTLALVIAPIFGASAIAEERDEGTLSLLVITGSSEVVTLGSKVLSRLVLLGVAVLTGAPLLSVIMTVGGVGFWDVVGATSIALFGLIVFGMVGAFSAVLGAEVMGALGLAAVWAGLMYVVVPLIAMLLGPVGWEVVAGANPWSSLGRGDWTSLAPLLPLLLAACVIIAWLGPVVRIRTTDDSIDEMGALSPEFWVLARRRRRIYAAALVVGPLGFVANFQAAPVAMGIAYLWASWMAAVVTALTLDLAIRIAHSVDVSARPLDRVVLERTVRGRVLGPPVLWRDLVTQGGAAKAWTLQLVGVGAWTAMWTMAHLDAFGPGGVEAVALLGVPVVLLVAALTSGRAMLDEVNGGTLPLLRIAGVSAPGLVASKLIGVLVRVAPLSALTYLFLGLIRLDLRTGALQPWDVPNLLIGALWFAGAVVMVSVTTMLVCARIPSPSRAWATLVSLTGAVGLVVVLTMQLEGSSTALHLVLPLFEGGWQEGPPSVAFRAAPLVSWLTALGGFVVLSVRLWRWGR